MTTEPEPTDVSPGLPVLLNPFQLAKELQISYGAGRRVFDNGVIKPDFLDAKGTPFVRLDRLEEIRRAFAASQPSILA